jgi:SAM-dependent methyltransferase
LGGIWQENNIGTRYVGVDLSEEQIAIGRRELEGLTTVTFFVGEMLSWSRQQPDDSILGVICLYTLFHLPRALHVDFLLQIKRILISNAPFLFTVPDSASESTESHWIGNTKVNRKRRKKKKTKTKQPTTLTFALSFQPLKMHFFCFFVDVLEQFFRVLVRTNSQRTWI